MQTARQLKSHPEKDGFLVGVLPLLFNYKQTPLSDDKKGGVSC